MAVIFNLRRLIHAQRRSGRFFLVVWFDGEDRPLTPMDGVHDSWYEEFGSLQDALSFAKYEVGADNYIVYDHDWKEIAAGRTEELANRDDLKPELEFSRYEGRPDTVFDFEDQYLHTSTPESSPKSSRQAAIALPPYMQQAIQQARETLKGFGIEDPFTVKVKCFKKHRQKEMRDALALYRSRSQFHSRPTFWVNEDFDEHVKRIDQQLDADFGTVGQPSNPIRALVDTLLHEYGHVVWEFADHGTYMARQWRDKRWIADCEALQKHLGARYQDEEEFAEDFMRFCNDGLGDGWWNDLVAKFLKAAMQPVKTAQTRTAAVKSRRLYHGSRQVFPPGFLLDPQPHGYVSGGDRYMADDAVGVRYTENIAESVRPPNCIPRGQAVFMVERPDLVDAAGGYDDHVYEVEPVGVVERSDLAWYSEMDAQDTDEGKAECARKYWAGEPFPSYSLFEWRARSAKVIREIP